MFIYPEIETINRTLVLGDNQHIMQQLLEKGYRGKFDMIYLDGPFNSGLIFSMVNEQSIEFVHPWDEVKSIRDYFQPNLYLEDYKKRIKLAKELLSNSGILVLQTNQFMGHYSKIKLDEVFGSENCLMEVIWKHSQIPWTYGIDQFGYQHETLFFYRKTSEYYKRTDIVFPSVWDDVGGYDLGEENTYFPSQKPEALLRRVLEATTQEKDLIGDFYCGSGTMPYVAERMNRRWFACDNHAYSIRTIQKRFSQIDIDLKVHSVVEEFNPDYLNGSSYTKKTEIPFSRIEQQTMNEFVQGKIDEINAYSYLSDVDLQAGNQFSYNLLMPSITENPTIEGSKIKLKRPIPIMTKEGYSLLVEDPLEWILHHLVHAERNKFNIIHVNKETNSYLIDRESLVSQAKEIEKQINNNWIQKVESLEGVVSIIDIFGYRYVINLTKTDSEI